MAKSKSVVFVGNVSVWPKKNPETGVIELALKKDPTGDWSNANAPELLAKMKKESKALKMPIEKWSYYAGDFPAGTATKVLLLGRIQRGWVAPYLCIVTDEKKETSTAAKKETLKKLF